MTFGENQEISTELSEDENNKINALGMIAKAKQDGEININELVNIENKIQEEQIEIKDSTEKKLNEYRNQILKKGISINSSNKERIFKYLEKEGFIIPNKIKNIEGDFSITIDEYNNIIEEGFFSTTYNNDSVEVSENDFYGEFNSELTNEFLDGEGREIIDNGLDLLSTKIEGRGIPNKFLEDIKHFINIGYESLSNEDKILMITSFDKIQNLDFNGALSLFKEELLKGDILDDTMLMFYGSIGVLMVILLGETMPLWLLAISSVSAIGSAIYSYAVAYDLISKQEKIHFKNQYIETSSIGEQYLKEDKLF